MKRKFLGGLYFGAGFAISYFVISWGAGWLMMYSSGYRQALEMSSSEPVESGSETIAPRAKKSAKPFHEMTLDEQIKHASVIARAEYEPGPDGRMQAIIKEFIKMVPGTTIYYDIGDEYSSSSYYPDGESMYGEGVIIFFVDSPASMRRSMTYSGDRITGLGDMPLDVLREKVVASASSESENK